jgi:hypothetical protein
MPLTGTHIVTTDMSKLEASIRAAMDSYIGQPISNKQKYKLNPDNSVDPYYNLNIQIDELKKELSQKDEQIDAVCGLMREFRQERDVVYHVLSTLIDGESVEDMEMKDAEQALHDSNRQCEEWKNLRAQNGLERL